LSWIVVDDPLSEMGVPVSRSSSVQKSENALVRYIKDTRAELAKVTWPTRQEGIRLTLVVLAVTAVAAVVLFGVDSIFSYLIALFVQAF
jgi:preprotein translocase subunit SecE